jgi:hypothetical protein
MNPLEEILNKTHQRAGLLAVLTGVLQTSECEATIRSISSTLEHIFKEYPVGDELEKRIVETMDEARDPDQINYSAQMKRMFEQIGEILKDGAPN